MICGIGTDIQQISDLERVLTKDGLFLQKVYSTQEIQYCKKHRNAAQHFAARWAAKALVKALGTGIGKFRLKDISIRNKENGQPYFVLYGDVKKYIEQHDLTPLLSVSHSADYAVSTVVVTTRF